MSETQWPNMPLPMCDSVPRVLMSVMSSNPSTRKMKMLEMEIDSAELHQKNTPDTACIDRSHTLNCESVWNYEEGKLVTEDNYCRDEEWWDRNHSPTDDDDRKRKIAYNRKGSTEVEEVNMKQQVQAAKRPQTPALASQQRYPPREVPPRFMQQQKQQFGKGKKGEADFSNWSEAGTSVGWSKMVVSDDHDKDGWPLDGGHSDVHWEVVEDGASGALDAHSTSSSPTSVSGSVITSSSGTGSWSSPGNGGGRARSQMGDAMVGSSSNTRDACGPRVPAALAEWTMDGSCGDTTADSCWSDGFQAPARSQVQQHASAGLGGRGDGGCAQRMSATDDLQDAASSAWGAAASVVHSVDKESAVWKSTNLSLQQQNAKSAAMCGASPMAAGLRNIPSGVPAASQVVFPSGNPSSFAKAITCQSNASPSHVGNAQYSSPNGLFSEGLGGDGGFSRGGGDASAKGCISGWNPLQRVGLLGGGENSVNTGGVGWGQAPSGVGGAGGGMWNAAAQGSNTAQPQWGAGGGGPAGPHAVVPGPAAAGGSPGPSSKPLNSWAQAAKGLNAGGGGAGSQGSSVGGHDADFHQSYSSQDGWGQGLVNQDTSWDVPGSPEQVTKESGGATVWRSSLNNGTEIWENNVRNGGKSLVPGTPTNVQPWGSNPSTNIGGTWGEEEDTSNVWTGVPQQQQQNNSSGAVSAGPALGSSWGGNGGNGGVGNSGGCVGGGGGGVMVMPPPPSTPALVGCGGGGPDKPWVSTNKDKPQWNNSGSSPGWGEPASSVASSAAADDGTSAWASSTPSSSSSSAVHINNKPVVPRASLPSKEIKPCGWEEPSPPTARRIMTSSDDGTAVWGSPHNQGKVCRWKDMPSTNAKGGGGPPMPTSSQPSTPTQGHPPVVVGGSGVLRILSSTPTGLKPDSGPPGWNKPISLNRSGYGESSHDAGGNGNWDDMPAGVGGGMKNSGGVGNNSSNWGEPGSPLPQNWGNKSRAGWSDAHVDTSGWGPPPPKQGSKPLNKDLIWASRPFRVLVKMGLKEEDVENALRNSNMNLEEALTELQSGASGNLPLPEEVFVALANKLRDEDQQNTTDQSPFANASMGTVAPFSTNLYANPGVIPGGPNAAAAFKSQPAGVNGSGNPAFTQLPNPVPGLANLNPSLVHKLLQQQQSLPQFQAALGQNLGGQPRVHQQQSVPSTAQLKLIVQQIQMAVQAGHLNPQILNQPLAPQTLLLVNQLLQQIKQLQQLQLGTQQHLGKANTSAALHASVQITKTKQQIANLQNQIVAQQALYVKQQHILQQHLQQQQQQHHHHHHHQQQQQPGVSAAEYLKPSLDPLALIQGGLQDLALKESAAPVTPTSRLSQWKLPSLDKDLEASMVGGGASEFSRAPGPVAKASVPAGHPAHTNLFGSGDSAWSLTRSQSDSGWPESPSGDINMNGGVEKDIHWNAPNQPNYNLGDLVTEFEPGKPWKGSQLKNIEDDPHITPGSVARSPLNSIKESDLFGSLTKCNPVSTTDSSFAPLGLSSATWSFNSSPTTASASSTSSAVTAPISSGSAYGKKWGSMGAETHSSTMSSELWGASAVSKVSRGPPPGLGSHGKPLSSNWAGGGGGGGGVPVNMGRHGWGVPAGVGASGSARSGWDRQNASTWLMLRNLTPQIDGSTLRTLCMQHGPLQAFHLYLSQGIALVRYSTREEAAKAQNALNNCVLGNTTIFADFANENDMQQFLQQSGHGVSHVSAWNQHGGVGARASVTTTAPSYAAYGGGGSSSSKGDVSAAPHWNGAGVSLQSNQLWSHQSGAGPWGMADADQQQHRATPSSSLNSFLPGDLLGGESV